MKIALDEKAIPLHIQFDFNTLLAWIITRKPTIIRGIDYRSLKNEQLILSKTLVEKVLYENRQTALS